MTPTLQPEFERVQIQGRWFRLPKQETQDQVLSRMTYRDSIAIRAAAHIHEQQFQAWRDWYVSRSNRLFSACRKRKRRQASRAEALKAQDLDMGLKAPDLDMGWDL